MNMKRIFSLILTIALAFCFTSCKGNYAQTDLNEPMTIPESGIIEKKILDEIKKENAIAVFEGNSNSIHYEWTIFGSDIKNTRDINLSIELTETDNGIKTVMNESSDFGFPLLLSIHLNEKWTEQNASAYNDGKAVYSVSVTGSKTTILNIPIDKVVSEFTIAPVTDSYSDSQPQTEKVYTEEDIIQTETVTSAERDEYLSGVNNSDNRIYSDGNATDQDKYKTDPVPEGKPMPVEPENQEINNDKAFTCTFSIECSTILNNLNDLEADKREIVPSNGIILPLTVVTFYEGESVFDVLQRVCKKNNIHMEASWTPVYNSAYVEGINNLYEFDCGNLSGWMYCVDGWYPNYGCSRYQLKDGETVEFRYTCDLGKDVSCDWMG